MAGGGGRCYTNSGVNLGKFKPLKIKYFTDTNTVLLEFSGLPVYETREINENIYLDLDVKGNLVSMTIEHAKAQTSLPELVFQQFEKV